MAVKGRGNQRKRTAATRDQPAEKTEQVVGAGKIDVPSDAEDDSQSDNTEEGDFDTMLQEMADDQGFDSDGGDEFVDDDEEDVAQDNEVDSIHSSDVDGDSSDEDSEDADSEDADSDDGSDDESGGVLERTASITTNDQDTA
ncbi:hypothetical protein EV176_006079, partial [Coemansia sp. RSA 451]